MTSPVDDRELCHERLGEKFETSVSDYDTGRRLSVLIDEFFTDEMLRGRRVLDVGSGLGFFSERAHKRGAEVVACDIGPGLLEKTRARVGCETVVADACALLEKFEADSFDVVISSECIEHTRDPDEALRQMAALVKPGGYLAVSTPNVRWSLIVKLATKLKLRPYDGFENFSSWRGIRRVLQASGMTIERESGLHLFPFQIPLHGLSTWCDRHLQGLRGCMINICVLARKPQASNAGKSIP